MEEGHWIGLDEHRQKTVRSPRRQLADLHNEFRNFKIYLGLSVLVLTLVFFVQSVVSPCDDYRSLWTWIISVIVLGGGRVAWKRYREWKRDNASVEWNEEEDALLDE